MRYDLAIIGSGSAAFAAAITARDLGAEVVMVESHTIGGTCINVGCVPSKALLAAAEARQTSLEARFPGVDTTPFGVDAGALIAGTQQLVATLRTEKYVDLAAQYGWRVHSGDARFERGERGPVLAVDHDGRTVTVEARHYLVATGASPWAPPIPGLAKTGYLTSTTALALEALPRSMIVIGGNAVGLEQAQLWSRLGVRVTVVEALERLAPFEEPELSAVVDGVFTDEGITVRTGVNITSVARDADGYHLWIHGGADLIAEQLLVATGRRPATAGLGLENVGVTITDRGAVAVDEHQGTDNARIWAAGDVTGGPQFVYVAAAQGTLAARNMLTSKAATLDYRTLPRVTFTDPALASVGLTDAQAAEAGIDSESRVLDLAVVSRARVDRDTRGVVKLIAERGTGRLLGAHVVAHDAGDIIGAAVLALEADMTIDRIAHSWIPYLTMGEAIKLCAQSFERDVATLSCCAA